jgi:general secretion pathway protein A
MPREQKELSVRPLRGPPVPKFIHAHCAYAEARARMREFVGPSDDILVITGVAGIGKSTLVAALQAELASEGILVAMADASEFRGDDLLPWVSSAFEISDRYADKCTLLEKLDNQLRLHTHALLVIDEAHMLTEPALQELRLLSYMRTGRGPLLQIYLVGRDELLKQVNACDMALLGHWHIEHHSMAPMNLQETHNHLIHWLGSLKLPYNPALTNKASILVQRFSRGIPGRVSKLCEQLAQDCLSREPTRLDINDIVAAIKAIKSQQPSSPQTPTDPDVGAATLHMHGLTPIEYADAVQNFSLALEEKEFMEKNPEVSHVTMGKSLPDMRLSSSAVAVSSQPHTAAADRDGIKHKAPPALSRTEKASSQSRTAQSAPIFRVFGPMSGLATLVMVAVLVAYKLGEYQAGRRSAEAVENSPVNPHESVLLQTIVPSSGLNIPAKALAVPVIPHIFPVRAMTRLTDSPKRPRYEAGTPESSAAAPPVPPQMALTEEAGAVAQDVLVSPDMPVPATESEELYQLLLSASEAVKKDFLVTPADKSAVHFYKQVLERDPGNAMAEQGLKQVAARYAQLTSLVIGRQEYDKAELYIKRGLSVVSGDARLLELRGEVQTSRELLAALQERDRVQAAQVETIKDSEDDSDGLFGALRKLFSSEPDPD